MQLLLGGIELGGLDRSRLRAEFQRSRRNLVHALPIHPDRFRAVRSAVCLLVIGAKTFRIVLAVYTTLATLPSRGVAALRFLHLPCLFRLILNGARSEPRSLRERVQLSQRVLRMFVLFERQAK